MTSRGALPGIKAIHSRNSGRTITYLTSCMISCIQWHVLSLLGLGQHLAGTISAFCLSLGFLHVKERGMERGPTNSTLQS
jgi:hypothetical protein